MDYGEHRKPLQIWDHWDKDLDNMYAMMLFNFTRDDPYHDLFEERWSKGIGGAKILNSKRILVPLIPYDIFLPNKPSKRLFTGVQHHTNFLDLEREAVAT